MSEPRRVRIVLAGAVLIGVTTDLALLNAAGELVHAGEHKLAQRVALAGTDAWLKCEPIAERARWRHSLRRWLGARAACIAEFDNLRWLREHGFRAPEPLAAGVIVRGGLVRGQVLVTRWLGAQRTLDAALQDATPAERTTRLLELARDVARLHALDFVHRDLFPRNLLIDAEPRPIFIDCRRGGRPQPKRDAEYDVGCLMLEGASLFTRDEQVELFRCYFTERSIRGPGIDRHATLAAANRCRDVLLAQIARTPARWRATTPPRADWPWREIADALA